MPGHEVTYHNEAVRPGSVRAVGDRAKPTEPAEFRAIEHVSVELTDPVRDRWEPGDDDVGVRLYCTQSPKMFDQPGREGARWLLQVHAWVKTKAGRGKHFAIGNASMSREDLKWLRDQISAELRRKR